MKIQALVFLATAATLFAQDAPISCRASFDAVKNVYPKDAAAGRFYATTEARIRSLEGVAKDKQKNEIYIAELKNCDLAVELFRVQLSSAALRKDVDSLAKSNLAIQKEISAVKDSLIELWTSDAKGAKSLNAALSDERNRLEKLNKEKAEEQALLAAELAKKEKALAEKDSLLAAQKAEAEKKLNALQSKTINVYRDARGTILAMSDILFETGKADLKPELRENLSAIGAILQSLLTESKVEVGGHTDTVGGADFNLKLSKQRAEAVLNYLVGRGVEEKRLNAVGYGLTKPICPANDNDECKAKNRRVELVIKDS
jgi:outer membrane protein OmpA-like peptidoglycan-associated protein